MADTLQPSTLRNYCSHIENHIRTSLGDKQLVRLTPKDVQRFYDWPNGSLASGTVCRIHTTLHSAQNMHLIANNPTEQIVAPSQTDRTDEGVNC